MAGREGGFDRPGGLPDQPVAGESNAAGGPGGPGDSDGRSLGGGLSAMAIRRPVTTGMAMLALVVLGIYSFRRLAIDMFPSVDIPVVAVMTVYPGASPETIEREVTRRLEESFNTVQGVDEVWSYSLESVSQVVVFFDLDRKVDEAAQDVRAKIDAVRRLLPTDIEAPVVQTWDPMAMPILSLALSSETLPIEDLTVLADETVRRGIESVTGVGEVRLSGGLARQIRVSVLPERLQALGVTVPDVVGALQRQNLEVPAGRVEPGGTEQFVRVMGRIQDPAEFADVIVGNRSGEPIRLAEVARVELATEDERSFAFVDHARAVALDILKVSGANTVDVADRVQEELELLQTQMPPGVDIRVVRDNSVAIRQSVDAVLHELVLGALLTVLVVLLFLNDYKATVITALALPISVISAFTLMMAFGFTINLITLLALALSIGILIDDAIVVIENIVRHRQLGEPPLRAAAEGTREIILAVMATTFSIVAVFVPVAFMGGYVGRYFYQFGLTVGWAVLISLLVSFTLTPMLSAHWGVDPHGGEEGRGGPLHRVMAAFDRWFSRQTGRYRTALDWSLRHRRTTLAIATASFVGALALLPLVGGEFFPRSDSSEFNVTFDPPEGASPDYSRRKGEQVIDIIRGLPGVDYVYTTITAAGESDIFSQGAGLYVKLVDPDERELSQEQLVVLARDRISAVFGVETAVSEASMGGPGGGIEIIVRGPEMDVLQTTASAIREQVRGVSGVVDLQLSVDEPRPEYRIDVDRDVANEVGVDVAMVAMTLRPLFAGEAVTRWEDPTGEEREVVVQLAPEHRRTVEDVATLPVATMRYTEAGTPVIVPLGQVARIERSGAPGRIDRRNLQRVISITGGTTPEVSLASASGDIRTAIAGMDLPAGYSAQLGGETQELEETVGYVVEALVLAIILIYLILASQFESVLQPFTIMLSLPLSLVGVVIALLLTGSTLNMMSMIGVILLMGLVTKNAILLVDNANQRRREGVERHRALLEAGAVRLRPILMTTLAMIFGMLPIALAMSEGSGFRAPMARAVIGGLITSTMLTLLVVPVAYTYSDDVGAWLRRRLGSGAAAEPAPAPAPDAAVDELERPGWGEAASP